MRLPAIQEGSAAEAMRRRYAPFIDESHRAGMLRFFKEEIQVHGIRGADLKSVAADAWKDVKSSPKKGILSLCDELIASPFIEDKTVALDWAFRLKRAYEPSDFDRFARWLMEDTDNWATCDDLCTHPLGELLVQHPELHARMRRWPRSPNRWVRRGSAVALIRPNRRGILAREAYRTAELLLEDRDDMVQKGYGWMLKELSKREMEAVHAFVMERRDRMPRTALRYAIEKMPEAMRREAMRRV